MIINRHILVLIASIFFAISAYASTLCSKGEVTYFSCQLKKSQKIVSLCGNVLQDSTNFQVASDAWLQYRFGTLQRLELIYPEKKENSLSEFTWLWQHPYRGFVKELSFGISKFRYTLFSVTFNGEDTDEGNGVQGYGVRIERVGVKEVSPRELLCSAPPIGNFDFNDVFPNNK